MPAQPESICVVDDDASVRNSIERLLDSDGLKAQSFEDAEAFFAHAGSHAVPWPCSMCGWRRRAACKFRRAHLTTGTPVGFTASDITLTSEQSKFLTAEFQYQIG
jgi:CheY-like chemotaxis protein